MSSTEKGHGFLRKRGGKLVSGIILSGAVFLTGHIASADEVKTPTEVKNVAELLNTPDVSKVKDGVEDNNAIAKSNKETENSPEQIKVNDQLNKIVSDAKAKGVDVTFEGETKVSPEQADEAVKKVEEKVNKTVEEHSKQVEEYNKKLAEVKDENEKIQKENQAIENSNKNAKAVLTKDSTAKETNGVYTQTLKGISKTENSANLTGVSKGAVSITTGVGIKLISAELLSPSGQKQALEVKDNKVAYNGVLSEKGEYKVNYSFASSANQKEQIMGMFTIDSETQDITTQDKKVNAPMDLIAMVDESPSYSSFSSTIFPLLKEMMKDANPKTRMAFYGTSVNEDNSHIIRKGSATRWLSMEEANKFIDSVVDKMNKREREGWQDKYANSWFRDAIKENPQFAVEEKYYNKEIEQAHKDLQNKNKVFNIIQVTDGWSANDRSIRSFAEYAKANAKTFVSVVQATGDDDFVTGQMKQYGLNNVVNLNPIKDIDKIVSYFKQVAVETEVVKGKAKQDSIKDTKTDKVEPTQIKKGRDLIQTPEPLKNSKVVIEAIKVDKPTPKPVEDKPTPKPVEKPTTIHIDTEGHPVAPQEDGTKPFKEIEGYKPAPKDFKNVEDPKGVTVRVYEKVKPETPQEAPKTPEKPETPKPTVQESAPKSLPNTGTEVSVALIQAGFGILGLSGLVYKKKED